MPRPERAPLAASPAIARLEARLAHAQTEAERTAAIEAFWAGDAARTPIVEPDPGSDDGRLIVTFCWRDDTADEVLLAANRLTDERNLGDSLMRRVPGTDIWHLAYRMRPDWRAAYSFVVRRPGERAPWRDGADQVAIRAALDAGLPDPRNPVRCLGRGGLEHAVVELPSAPAQPWRAGRGSAPRGEVSAVELPDGRTGWTYASPGLDPEAPAPLAIVLDGEVWLHRHGLPGMLDAAAEDGAIPPLRAVLVDSGGVARRWQEHEGERDLASWLAGPLLDWTRERLRAGLAPEATAVAGQSLGGLTALRTVIRHPGRIARAVSQSASLWQDPLVDDARAASLEGVRVLMEVGSQEWVLQPLQAPLAAALAEAGADVRAREYNGGHDYACWRGGLLDGLVEVLDRA